MKNVCFGGKILGVFASFLFMASLTIAISAQTTGFNYQGQLQSSSALANGNFDFEFLLYDALSGGSQIGTTLTQSSVAVANGIFSVPLDFGSNFPGGNRFLEIHVRQTGGGTFTPLLPRQAVSSDPYSIKSLNADTATNATNAVNAQNASTAVNATTAGTAANFSGALNGDVTGTQSSTAVTRLRGQTVAAIVPTNGQVLKFNTTTNQWEPNTDNTGAGGGVTGVTASGPLTSSGGTSPNVSLTGVVPTVNGGTGLSASGVSGNLVRSNGSTWTSSTLQVSDVPDISASYIKNTTFPQAGSNFSISGNGVVGGKLTANAGVFGSSQIDHGVEGQSVSGVGLLGSSNSGIAIYGTSITGTAGQFNGRVLVGGPLLVGAAVAGSSASLIVGAATDGVYATGSNIAVYGYGGLTGRGVLGVNSSNGIGVDGSSQQGIGVRGTSSSGTAISGDSTSGTGISGTTGGLIGNVAGVYGKHGAGNGPFTPLGAGVWGDSLSGSGVAGSSTSGLGVYGYSRTGTGVLGESFSGPGLYGTSTNGPGASIKSFNGNIIEGNNRTDLTFRVTNSGRIDGQGICVGPYCLENPGRIIAGGAGGEFTFLDRGATSFVDNPTNGQRWLWYGLGGKARLWSGSDRLSIDPAGNVRAVGTIVGGQTPDIAETIAADPSVTTGDVVCADPLHRESVVRCSKDNHAILGVISDGTGAFLINSNSKSVDGPLTGMPLVLAGRVPVKVSLENGPISIGDFLAPSSTPGEAMRAGESGPSIGIALEAFDPPSKARTGTVLCFVKVGEANVGAAVRRMQDTNALQNKRLEQQQKQMEKQNVINQKQGLEIDALKALVCRSHRSAAVCRAKK